MSEDRRHQFEAIFDNHPVTGFSIEVFYADRALETFGRRGAGWFWQLRRRGFAPEGAATGPFPTSYSAYRKALLSSDLRVVGISVGRNEIPNSKFRVISMCWGPNGAPARGTITWPTGIRRWLTSTNRPSFCRHTWQKGMPAAGPFPSVRFRSSVCTAWEVLAQ